MKKFINKLIKSNINLYASSLTYYALLSFFPFLIVFLFIASKILMDNANLETLLYKNMILILKNLPIQNSLLNQNAIEVIKNTKNINTYSIITLSWAWINFEILLSKSINNVMGQKFKWDIAYILKIIIISFFTFTTIILINLIYFIILPYSKKIIKLPAWLYQDIVLFIILLITLFLIYKFIPYKNIKNTYKILFTANFLSIFLILLKHFFLTIININKYYFVYSNLTLFIILLIWIYIELYLILLGAIIINT